MEKTFLICFISTLSLRFKWPYPGVKPTIPMGMWHPFLGHTTLLGLLKWSAFKSSILAFFEQERGKRGGCCGFCFFFNSVGYLMLLGGLGAAEPPHEPRVIAAPCSPGGMSSTCWSKPRGRGTCEHLTGKPTEQGIKVRDHGDGRARTASQGKIKVSRALLMETVHCGWPLSGSFLPSGC